MVTATSEQQPPVNNSQTKSGQANFDNSSNWITSSEGQPLYNGHFFGVPKVAVVDRLGAGATFDWLFFDNSKVINFDD